MAFADYLLSFHGCTDAVGHMEQEDPLPGGHTSHIYTFLQLQAQHTKEQILELSRFTVKMKIYVVENIYFVNAFVPFRLVSDLPEAPQEAVRGRCRHKPWRHPESQGCSGLDWHLGLTRRKHDSITY